MTSPTASSKAADSFLWTLKRLDRELLALGSPLRQTVQSLYHLMTSDQRAEAIGRINRLSHQLGIAYAAFLLMEASPSSSKTASTTSPSSGGRMALGSEEPPRTQCSSSTASSLKA